MREIRRSVRRFSGIRSICTPAIILVVVFSSSCSYKEGLEGSQALSSDKRFLKEQSIQSDPGSSLRESSIQSLTDDLNAFNIHYQNIIDNNQKRSGNSSGESSGFWHCLCDALEVAGADITGAGAGAWASKEIAAGVGLATGGTGAAVVSATCACIAGAGASIATARSLSPDSIGLGINLHLTKPAIANLDIEYPERYKYLKDVGKAHNIRVNDLMLGKRDAGISKYKNPIIENVLNSNRMKALNRGIKSIVVKYVNGGLKSAQLTSSMYEEGYITENMESVYHLFFNIYNHSANKTHIRDIVNYYITSVAKTDALSEGEREALIASFSVASESPFLWKRLNFKN